MYLEWLKPLCIYCLNCLKRLRIAWSTFAGFLYKIPPINTFTRLLCNTLKCFIVFWKSSAKLNKFKQMPLS